MLPNHPPLTVAEQFGTLEALHPGRIDLGIGRAPGTDRETAHALRRSVDGLPAADFARQLAELQAYFAGQGAVGRDAAGHATDKPRIRAIPAEDNEPAIWLLGTTGYSAELAGLLGLRFAFAHHLSAANARPALALYRKTFTPSETLNEPYSLISVAVLCAKDAAEARWLHGSTRLSALRQRGGRPSTLPSPEEAAIADYSAAERTVMEETTSSDVVGDSATVIDRLTQLVTSTGADELMVTTSTFAHAARINSYELLVRAAGRIPSPGEQPASALSAVDPVEVLRQVGHACRPGQARDRAEGLR